LSPAIGIPMSFVYAAVPVGTALMLFEWLVQIGVARPISDQMTNQMTNA
jgi:TRAP-type C4-dicarboxylate transport system permease small subunit